MGPRLDRRTLSKVNPTNLIRLAIFIGISVKDKCECDKCMHKLIEVVVRKLDVEEKWPQRLLERNW